eukprot:3154426-Prymnesium_polylepis.2
MMNVDSTMKLPKKGMATHEPQSPRSSEHDSPSGPMSPGRRITSCIIAFQPSPVVQRKRVRKAVGKSQKL